MPRSKRHVCSTAPVRRALQHSYIAQRRIERAKEGVSRVHADSLRGAIDTYQGRDLTNPRFASEIALQLLRSGRAEEALSYLDRARPSVENRYFGKSSGPMPVLPPSMLCSVPMRRRLCDWPYSNPSSAHHICALSSTGCPTSMTSRPKSGRSMSLPSTRMFMRRWPFWWSGRHMSALPDWSNRAPAKSTAIAMSCSTRPQRSSKANTHWPRSCSAGLSSRSRCTKAAPHATNTRLGMSVRSTV